MTKGFTIIEALVAIFIVTLAVVGVAAVDENIPVVRLAKDQDLALKIAGEELESARGAGYSSLPSSGSFTNSLLSSLPNGQGSLTVSTFNTQAKEVAVTVSWQEPNQSTASSTVTLTTLVAETGGLE